MADIVALFSDLAPTPQDDGEDPVAAIMYSQEFRQVMDLFRSVVANDELSERALALTWKAIELNPGNYSAWHYRRRCLEHLESDMQKELSLIREFSIETPKNYQVWYHRRVILERLQDFSQENSFTYEILAEDSKNYHCWAHRQWVLSHTLAWDEEFNFIDEMLDEDIYNNSAWNQRWYVVSHSTGWSEETALREIEFVFQKLSIAVNNDSSWNYLKGILHQTPSISSDITTKCLQLKEELAEPCKNLLALLLEIYQKVNPEQAREICRELEEVDPIRRKYWQYRQQQL